MNATETEAAQQAACSDVVVMALSGDLICQVQADDKYTVQRLKQDKTIPNDEILKISVSFMFLHIIHILIGSHCHCLWDCHWHCHQYCHQYCAIGIAIGIAISIAVDIAVGIAVGTIIGI